MALTARRIPRAPAADGAGPDKEGQPAASRPPVAGRQVAKSAATRARLIDATIRCLVRHGYAGTVTPLVAAEAGLSRGAMLHHFPTGESLVRATIAELHERRLNAFRRASIDYRGDVRAMVRSYWQQLQKPGFIAFQELAMAARTDPLLASILLPLQTDFSEKFQRLAGQLYPDWVREPDRLALAMALSQILTQGMAIASLTGALDDRLIDPMLDFLEASVRALRPGGEAPGIEEGATPE